MQAECGSKASFDYAQAQPIFAFREQKYEIMTFDLYFCPVKERNNTVTGNHSPDKQYTPKTNEQ